MAGASLWQYGNMVSAVVLSMSKVAKKHFSQREELLEEQYIDTCLVFIRIEKYLWH